MALSNQFESATVSEAPKTTKPNENAKNKRTHAYASSKLNALKKVAIQVFTAFNQHFQQTQKGFPSRLYKK